MNWSVGETIWLGVMAYGVALILAFGIRDMFRPAWKRLSRFGRAVHVFGLALVSVGLVYGMVLFFTINNGKA